MYSLIPGRCIFRDGRPLVTVQKAGYTRPTEADDFAHVLVYLLNHYPLPEVDTARAANRESEVTP